MKIIEINKDTWLVTYVLARAKFNINEATLIANKAEHERRAPMSEGDDAFFCGLFSAQIITMASDHDPLSVETLEAMVKTQSAIFEMGKSLRAVNAFGGQNATAN